jgi:hypothetical protein
MESHVLLDKYVEMVAQGHINSLVIRGQAGLGKTFSILEKLKALGLEEGKHFIYVSGYITPLKLFVLLNKCSILEDPRIFVFDDLDSVLSNKTCVALLKSALAEARGKRIISYESSSSKVSVPKSYEFNGRVIIVVNSIKEEQVLGRSLLDRGIYYEMEMTTDEVVAYIEKVLPNMYNGYTEEEKQLVWDKVKRFADSPQFSLRALNRAFAFYKFNKDDWYTMFIRTMGIK